MENKARRYPPITNAWSDAEAGALIGHAVWAVDGLHYLMSIDQIAFEGPGQLHGAHTDTVELTHVRWAATSALTALDLCAAALARRSGLYMGNRRAAIQNLNAAGPEEAKTIRTQLNPRALDWVNRVVRDSDYAILRRVRHPLTHSRLTRHISIGGAPASARRLSLPVGIPDSAGNRTQMGSRELLTLSADVATRHIESLLSEIAAGLH